MVIKRGYVQTEMYRHLADLKEELGEDLTSQDILEELPDMYKKLKEDPENPLGDVPYNIFYQAAIHMLEAYRRAGYPI